MLMQNSTFRLMQSLKSHLLRSSNHLCSHSVTFLLLSPFSTTASNSKGNTFITDFLNANFKFSTSQSFYVSKRVSGARSPQNPFSVLTFFKQFGFTQPQILSMVRNKPQILFADVDKILKPKIEFFRMLGIEGSKLCDFISKNSPILTSSLEKSLVPSVEAISKIVSDDDDFIQILHRCGWVLPKYKKIMSNIVFLESCGIAGSHLSLLIKLHPRIFITKQSTIEKHVSRAVELGFRENSRMFVHGIHSICSLSYKTYKRKLELLIGFGFSKEEGLQMFRRCPTLLRTSEKKLKFGMEFYLHTAMLPKSALVHQPRNLMYSMEDRVLPRYRVFQLLESKNLCKKVPSYMYLLGLSEEMFLDKYISRFREDAEELLVAYKGHYLKD